MRCTSTTTSTNQPVAPSSAAPVPTLAISALEIARLPLAKFPGRVVVISVPEDEERVRTAFEGEAFLGLDTETRPSSAASPKNRLALVQVATSRLACLWRVGEMRCIPPLLRKLIEDPSRHKIAQGATHEVDVFRDEWCLSPQSFIDLHHIALHLKTNPRSLQGLVALFLGKRLGKEQRLSNWEQSPLTQAQIEYAALDAWAGREVLLAMRRTYGVERLPCERSLGVGRATFRPQDEELNLRGAAPSTLVHDGHEHEEAEHRAQKEGPGRAIPSPRQPVASTEAHQNLAALCVERGYVLRFDGFESAPSGFRCVFRVEYRHRGRSVVEAFRSQRVHTTIRAAQNDAASEALLRLKPLDGLALGTGTAHSESPHTG